jgi:hypothetical protein
MALSAYFDASCLSNRRARSRRSSASSQRGAALRDVTLLRGQRREVQTSNFSYRPQGKHQTRPRASDLLHCIPRAWQPRKQDAIAGRACGPRIVAQALKLISSFFPPTSSVNLRYSGGQIQSALLSLYGRCSESLLKAARAHIPCGLGESEVARAECAAGCIFEGS